MSATPSSGERCSSRISSDGLPVLKDAMSARYFRSRRSNAGFTRINARSFPITSALRGSTAREISVQNAHAFYSPFCVNFSFPRYQGNRFCFLSSWSNIHSWCFMNSFLLTLPSCSLFIGEAWSPSVPLAALALAAKLTVTIKKGTIAIIQPIFRFCIIVITPPWFCSVVH